MEDKRMVESLKEAAQQPRPRSLAVPLWWLMPGAKEKHSQLPLHSTLISHLSSLIICKFGDHINCEGSLEDLKKPQPQPLSNSQTLQKDPGNRILIGSYPSSIPPPQPPAAMAGGWNAPQKTENEVAHEHMITVNCSPEIISSLKLEADSFFF